MNNYLTALETRKVIGLTGRVISKAPYHGNVLAASRRCGVSQPTLSRFYSAPPQRLPWKTFRGLWKLDPSLDWEGLVLSKEARRVLDLWDQWVEGKTHLRDRIRKFLTRTQELGRIEVSELSRKKVDEFRDWARKKGHTERRINLSLNRALGGLFPVADTGGLERSCIHLTQKEVDRYIKAALTCERILLSHPPADLQAREMYPTDRVGRLQEAAMRYRMRKGKPPVVVKGRTYLELANLPRKRLRKSKAKRRPRNSPRR